MSNVILAKLIFFYTFYAGAANVACEGIIKSGKDKYRITMIEGRVVRDPNVNEDAKELFWSEDKEVLVDISESIYSEYEKKHNDLVQKFNPNSCYGINFRR